MNERTPKSMPTLPASLGTIITAMVTPFTPEMAVDYGGIAGLADFLLKNGSDGLVVSGTTGESPTLTDDEKIDMLRAVVDAAAGRGKVIAGTGSNDTEHSVHLTRRAEDAGADAVLVVTPYYNKPPERGLVAHFRAVAAATVLPVVIYNIPSRCGVNLRPEVLAELALTENIVAVKQANPDLDESRRLRELSPMGIYAGNDDMLLDIVAMGGWGGVCVASHLVGPQMRQLVLAVREGDMTTAKAINDGLAPLFKTLFIASNPIPLKAALNLLGHDAGGVRLPLVEASDDEVATVRAELERQGLL